MVSALLAGETLVLVLLSILVVGLLRSHAEILRRLDTGESESRASRDLNNVATAPERGDAPLASDISGSTLDGDAIQIGLFPGGTSTLVAFLSSGCSVCEDFWRDFATNRREELPGKTRLAIVVKDSSHERPARLRELAPSDLPVVMSSKAWETYEVPTTPYFVYVDGTSGRIYGEGAASSWRQVASLLADALDDLEVISEDTATSRGSQGGSSGADRALRAERELQEAGIGPGHPSLYPTPAAEGDAK